MKRSYPEKHEHWEKHPDEFERWLYVGELFEFLLHLRLDDWITPTVVYNLLIQRDNLGRIGWINLHHSQIEGLTTSPLKDWDLTESKILMFLLRVVFGIGKLVVLMKRKEDKGK